MTAAQLVQEANGAAGVANTSPHDDNPLKPKLSSTMAAAAMPAPPQSMTTSGRAATFCSRKLSARLTTASATTRAKDQRHPIVEAKEPATSRASTPAPGMAAARKPIALPCRSPE